MKLALHWVRISCQPTRGRYNHAMSVEFQYVVFLSHSSNDNAVVRGLAARLQKRGVEMLFDELLFKSGDMGIMAMGDLHERSGGSVAKLRIRQDSAETSVWTYQGALKLGFNRVMHAGDGSGGALRIVGAASERAK